MTVRPAAYMCEQEQKSLWFIIQRLRLGLCLHVKHDNVVMRKVGQAIVVLLSCLLLFACDSEIETPAEGPVDLRVETSPPPVPDELKQITFTKSEKSNAYIFTDSEKGQSSISYEIKNGEYYFAIKNGSSNYQIMSSPRLKAFLTVEDGLLVSAAVDEEELLVSQGERSRSLKPWLGVVLASFIHQVGLEEPQYSASKTVKSCTSKNEKAGSYHYRGFAWGPTASNACWKATEEVNYLCTNECCIGCAELLSCDIACYYPFGDYGCSAGRSGRSCGDWEGSCQDYYGGGSGGFGGGGGGSGGGDSGGGDSGGSGSSCVDTVINGDPTTCCGENIDQLLACATG